MIGPLHRLQPRLSGVPFPLWALAVCLAAALVGAIALDGYGVTEDEPPKRKLGNLTLDYIAGKSDELLSFRNDQHYGVAFELPLILAERALGLDDSRSIYRLRHYLTHLFFIAGAFFAALLAWRMTGSRWLGLFALLLFLLHPRLYAHSFFNSKDLPFLSMFVIALYLIHRAFRRDTLGAFVLCGVAIGLLTNIRIMGLMLFPAVIVMRGLDFGYEFRRPERRRLMLLTAGAFALAAILTLYATWPWLWGDPLSRFAEALTRMANFPSEEGFLFRGEIYSSLSPPWNYIPTWVAITTPPAGLLLGLAGAAAALYGGLIRLGQVFRNTPRRFEWLLLVGLILPVIAVIALDSTLYHDWRQMYFLYAPLSMLAVAGLQRLAGAAGSAPRLSARLFGGRKVPGGWAAVQGAVYGAAAVGLVTIAIQMLQLHPQQNLYFNFLVDRRTPEYLSSQYDMALWNIETRQGLEYLLERYPEGRLRVLVAANPTTIRILSAAQRQRLAVVKPGSSNPPDFYITKYPDSAVPAAAGPPPFPPLHTLQVYGNTIMRVAALDLSLVGEDAAARFRQRYREAGAGVPVIRSEFGRSELAVYRQGRTLSWVIEPCNAGEQEAGFELQLYPADPRRLFNADRNRGWVSERFPSLFPLVHFEGKCFAQTTLPEYELTRFRTSIGRFDADTGEPSGTWVGHYYPGLPEVQEAIARRRESEPPPGEAARWEVYQEGQRLLYAKAGCVPADREAAFFLHLTPVNPDDLPGDSREYGFDNLDFPFEWRGLVMGDECLAVVPLPDYPIAAIATGQYTGAGRLWETAWPLK